MAPAKETHPRILILVIHGPYEPWLSILHKGQKLTWMRIKSKSKVVNVFGLPLRNRIVSFDQQIYFLRWSKKKIVAYSALAIEMLIKKIVRLDRYRPKIIVAQDVELGEVWQIQMPDSLLLQGVKNMSTFRESIKYNYDFLVTTITSSFLNVPLLEIYLSGVKPEKFVGGRIEKSGDMTYQQGSFRVYSRDVVENLVKHSENYKHWKIEDIAMGDLTSTLYSEFTDIPNATIRSVADLAYIRQEDLLKTISYRCKSMENGFRNDAIIMKSLQEKIVGSV